MLYKKRPIYFWKPNSYSSGMGKLRTWISLAVILAFFAMMMPNAYAADVCCNQSSAAQQSVQGAGKGTNNPCHTDKSSCNDCHCLGNSCGMIGVIDVKVPALFAPQLQKTHFGFAEDDFTSGLLSRIKRPPRA